MRLAPHSLTCERQRSLRFLEDCSEVYMVLNLHGWGISFQHYQEKSIYSLFIHVISYTQLSKEVPYIIIRKWDQCNQDIFPERKYFIYDIIKMQKHYINMKKSAWDWIKLCLALYISDNRKGAVKNRRPGLFSASRDLQAWGFQSSRWHSFV